VIEAIVRMENSSLLFIKPRTSDLQIFLDTQSSDSSESKSLQNAINIKQDILNTASVLHSVRFSSRVAVTDSLRLVNAYAFKGQSQVDVLYARYLELGNSIISQLKIMKANCVHDPTGYSNNLRDKRAIDKSSSSSQHTVFLPGHFSRKGHWQKQLTHPHILNTSRNGNTASPILRVTSQTSSKNEIISLPSSPWEGSQYKLSLVRSLRSKVLLKCVFSAFSHNSAVQKYRREAASTCSKTRVSNMIKQCFYSILFEALSSRYVIMSSDQTVTELLLRKYIHPIFKKIVRLVTLKSLYTTYKKMAEDLRRFLLLRKGFVDLMVNRRKQKLLYLKTQWASSHDMKMTKTHSFLAWALALARKRTVKNVLRKRFNSLEECSLSLEEHSQRSRTSLISSSDDESDSCDFNLSDLLQEKDKSGKKSRIHQKSRLEGGLDGDDEDLQLFESLREEVHESMRRCFHRSIQGLKYHIERLLSGKKLYGNNESPLNTDTRHVRVSTECTNTTQFQRNQSLTASSTPPIEISLNRNSSERLPSYRQQHQSNEKVDDVRDRAMSDENRGGIVSEGLLKILQAAVLDNSLRKNVEVSGNDVPITERGSNSLHEQSDQLGGGLLRRAMNISSPATNVQHPKRSVVKERDVIEKVQEDKLCIGKLGYLKGYLKGHGSVEIKDEILQATRLIRRCMRYFNKLRAVRRISIAYRKVRRKFIEGYNRENTVRRSLSVWSRSAEKKFIQQELCVEIAILNSQRRFLRKWVYRSLLRLTEAAINVQGMLKLQRTRNRWIFWRNVWLFKKELRVKIKSLSGLENVVNKNFKLKRKKASLGVWLHEYYLQSKGNKIKRLKNVRVVLNGMRIWIQKVKNRTLLKRVFSIQAHTLNLRMQQVSTPFRLLSSIIIAWRKYTHGILLIKKEIYTLQKEKDDLAIAAQIEKEREAKQTELEIMEFKAYKENMTVAVIFRKATLKAEMFYTWRERVTQFILQKAAFQIFHIVQKKISLKKMFKQWSMTNSNLTIYENIFTSRVLVLLCRRRESKAYLMWSVCLNRRMHVPLMYLHRRLLRISFRDWRLSRTTRLLREKLGNIRGLYKLHLQRGFKHWGGSVLKMQNVKKGIQILEMKLNRMMMKKALLHWPGWREWRRSEGMRRELLKKHRGRGRLLGIIDILEKNGKKAKTVLDHSSQGVPPIGERINQRLSLAERLAVEATYMMCQDYYDLQGKRTYVEQSISSIEKELPSTYTTALCSAEGLLSKRIKSNHGHLESNTLNIGQKHSKSKDQAQGGTGTQSREVQGTGAQSREVQAVEELLLLLRLVMMAWNKTAKTITNLRNKARRIRCVKDKRCLVESLKQWIDRTTSTSHRSMCWISPSIPKASYAIPLTLPKTIPPPYEFYAAIKSKKKEDSKSYSSLHTYNLQKLLPVSSVEMKVKAFPEWR